MSAEYAGLGRCLGCCQVQYVNEDRLCGVCDELERERLAWEVRMEVGDDNDPDPTDVRQLFTDAQCQQLREWGQYL